MPCGEPPWGLAARPPGGLGRQHLRGTRRDGRVHGGGRARRLGFAFATIAFPMASGSGNVAGLTRKENAMLDNRRAGRGSRSCRRGCPGPGLGSWWNRSRCLQHGEGWASAAQSWAVPLWCFGDGFQSRAPGLRSAASGGREGAAGWGHGPPACDELSYNRERRTLKSICVTSENIKMFCRFSDCMRVVLFIRMEMEPQFRSPQFTLSSQHQFTPCLGSGDFASLGFS